MLAVATLYVRPDLETAPAKNAVALGTIDDGIYKVIDLMYGTNGVQFGVCSNKSKLFYLPSFCWVMVDSKTKKPLSRQGE